MKNLYSIITITFLCVSIFSSCDKEESNEVNETSQVFLEKSYPGLFKINGQSVLTSEGNSGVNYSDDNLLYSNLPNGNYASFDISMFVPTDNTVSIQAGLESVRIIKTDGTEVPPFFAGGSVGGIDDVIGDGVSRQRFDFNFTYPSDAPVINKNNFAGMRFVFTFEYEDNNSGDILDNKTFSFTITADGNPGGGGSGGTGDAIFWIDNDYGCGPIEVIVFLPANNVNSTITGYFGTTPDCSNTNNGGNFNDLPIGDYIYNATCNGQVWSDILTINENSCSRIKLADGGGGNATGDVIFWVNQDFGCGPISVSLTGAGSTTITGFYSSTPSCSDTGNGGNINDIPAGNYVLNASCTGYTWNGSVTISENSCLRFQLSL